MMAHPSAATLDRIAQRFRLLGDPVRLRLLHAMAGGEISVNDLVAATGTGQANVSKHLGLLLKEGLVERRKHGLQVFYRVADPEVFALCDLVCGSLEGRLSGELSMLVAHRERSARAADRPEPIRGGARTKSPRAKSVDPAPRAPKRERERDRRPRSVASSGPPKQKSRKGA